ncbi:MAG TPA: DMT family transporter [Thermoanaerobaculia bacterium]|nr:DMT family transporter [Thermoanaerobaculia bacterium]
MPDTSQRHGPDGPAIAVLLLVQLLFATLPVAGKVVLREISPLALGGLRVLIATPLLLAYAGWTDRLLPSRRDWPRLALLGLLGIAANQGLFLLGLSFTTATSASILMPSIPVFTLAAGALLGVEKIGPRRVLGVALAAAGALVLLDPTRLTTGLRGSIGNLLILANCLCYAFFLVLLRPLLARLPWRTVVAWTFLFGGLGLTAISAPWLAATPWTELSRGTLAGILYIGLGPTAASFALNTWAVRRSSPSTAAAFTTLQPLLTAVLAAIWLAERPRPVQGVGFLLIVLGLVVAMRATLRASRRAA